MMNVCPLVSTRVAWVCSAVFWAICLVSSLARAVLSIFIFTIVVFSSCLSISLSSCGVAPFLPIHMLGWLLMSCRLT